MAPPAAKPRSGSRRSQSSGTVQASLGRYAATEMGFELPASVLRDPHCESAVGDRAVEGLEVVSHHRVQRGELGPMPAVALGNT